MSTEAAWRDASWFATPGTAYRAHAIVNGRAACGVPALDLAHAIPAEQVAVKLRCGRAACAKLWPWQTGPVEPARGTR